MDNKETLKTYYETGDKPTQEQFEKLIYACVGTLEKTDDLPVATSAQENVIYQIGRAFYQCKVLLGIYGWQYIGSLGADGKVRYDAGDVDGDYLSNRMKAGNDMDVNEGTGADVNKAVISLKEITLESPTATDTPVIAQSRITVLLQNLLNLWKGLYDGKLGYLQVVFSYSGETLTSTKTVAEILAAINANKQIIACYSTIIVFLTENITISGDMVIFTFSASTLMVTITGDGSGETDSWTLVEENIEKTSNKVSAWSVTPNDTNYPSEKLVKDTLVNKADLVGGLIPSSQLPSFVDDVIELRTYSDTAPTTDLADNDKYYAPTAKLIYTYDLDTTSWDEGVTPERGKIYVVLDDSVLNKQYRWGGSDMAAIVNSDIAGLIHASETKDIIVDADEFGFVDSENGNVLKKTAWNNIKAKLTTLFDAAYIKLSNLVTSISSSSTNAQIPSAKLLYDQLQLKVTGNSAITGATKTKITYDAKGLVTGGDDATTADIADSTNKRYCTDAEKTVISNTSNTNTGDQDASDFDIKDLTDSTDLKTTWNNKQAALGFTPENVANKENTTLDTSTTKYPTNRLVKEYSDGKVEDSITDGHTTIAPSGNAVYDALAGKQDSLTFGIANTNALKVDDASAADNEYAKLTANGIEGRSYTEVKQDLDLEIGTDVQAYDAGLTDIAGLAVTDGNIIVGNGTNWVAESGATARTSLGVTIGTDVAAQTHATQHAVGGSDSVFPTDPNADKYLKYNNASNALEWADVATPQLVYPLSDGAYSGFTIAGVLYETVAFGEAVYYDGTKWRKLSCLTTLIDYRAGVCVQAGNTDADTTILLYGTIRADSAYDFTVGNRVYSGYAAGQILSQVSTTIQNTYNVIPYILGTALDANTAFINPQFVEAQKMTGGGEATDPSTIQNVIRNNQWLVTFEAAGTTRSIAIAQTTALVVTYLDLQNTTGSDITVTFTPPSGKTIVKNYDSLVVAAGGHKLIRYWLVGTLLYIVDEDMAAGGTDSDEKVKYDASDPTAGYIVDKFVAGTGISLAEGTGANENKLVITNTGAGSGGLSYFTLTYYQAKPATCTTGETCFDTSDGKVYTATGTNTWDSGVAASTSYLYIWDFRIYKYISGTTLKPLSYGKKLEKSPTVTSNAFSWECSGERSKSYVSNNANTTCTVTPATGDTATEHSLLFTNSDSSASHTISFAAASGFTLKMLATTLTIPASGFVELSVELYGTVCYIKYSIN